MLMNFNIESNHAGEGWGREEGSPWIFLEINVHLVGFSIWKKLASLSDSLLICTLIQEGAILYTPSISTDSRFSLHFSFLV